jgi:hypothetical protein
MKRTWLAGAAGAAMLVSTALAHPTSSSASADNIAEELKGKLCTTRSGSYLFFATDGHYEYDGLWRGGGHYLITRDSVSIRLDNGLQRSFAISRRDGVIYMDQRALSCEAFSAQAAGAQ